MNSSMKHRIAYETEYYNFRKVFNANLKTYWDGAILGFNLVKFDDEIIMAPDGKSVEDVLQERHGDEGVRIIKALLLMDKSDE